METVLSDTGKEAEGPISSALGMEPDGKHATMAVSPLRRAHIDWSIYDKVTVSFAFMRQLTFHGMKRYVTIGQFRELVAQELLLPSTHVALEIDGLQLLVNTITLEDALGQGRLHLHMSYVTLRGKHYPYSILWGMTVHSLTRRFFIELVEWAWFDRISLVLIIVNVIGMMMVRPTNQDPGFIEQAQAWTDPIFSILFTFEMVCKLMAAGIALTPYTYMRDGWNWIDAAVVVSAWITWQTPGVVVVPGSETGNSGLGQALKPLRTVRVLRPLRTVTRVRGMRVVVQSLLNSVPEMASVLAIQGFIFVFFGIFGVQLFAGQLRWRCAPEDFDVEPCARNRSISDGDCVATDFSNWCQATLDGCLANSSCTLDEQQSCAPLWATTSQSGSFNAYTCDGSDPDAVSNCPNGGVCTYFTSNPNNNLTSFDHFPSAFVTIFYSMTLEGWVDAMYMLIAANRGMAPIVVIYFVILILFGSIFVFNLLLAVVFDNFSNINAESRAEEVTEDTEADYQQSNVREEEGADALAGKPDLPRPHLGALKRQDTATIAQASLHDDGEGDDGDKNGVEETRGGPSFKCSLKQIVSSGTFESCIVFAIIVNTCVMAVDWTPPPFGISMDGMQNFQFTMSAFFGIFFTVEMALKMAVLGVWGYFAVPMNRFDFFIVVMGLLEIVVFVVINQESMNAESAAVVLICVRALKGLRTLRLLRLMNIIDGMRKVVETLTKSAAHILYLFMILMLFCIIFALLGMETLAMDMYSSSTRFRFDNIYSALINIFVVLSGENWNDLLFEAGEYVGPWGPIFYFSLLIACNWILLNLFVAILLSNINDIAMEEQAQKLRVARALLRRLSKRRNLSSRRIGSPKRGKSINKQASPVTSPQNELALDVVSTLSDTAAATAAATAMPSPPASPPASPPGVDKQLERHISFEVSAKQADDHVTTITIQSPDTPESPGMLGMCGWFCSWERKLASTGTGDTLMLGNAPKNSLLQFVEAPAVAAVIQILILLSSGTLILDLPGTVTPGTVPDDLLNTLSSILQACEFLFTAIFTLEAALKIAAYRWSYFGNPWNNLDFVVILISWPSILLPGLSQFTFLRAMRSIRMLKLAAMHEGMRVVILSLYQSFPAIVNVMMVLTVFLVIFGILGMQLNAGRWGFCDIELVDGDPYGLQGREFVVPDRVTCETTAYHVSNGTAYNGTWMNPHYGNFDNIFTSMLMLFETATLERWPEVMLYMADSAWDQARPIDVPPYSPPNNEIYVFVVLFWVAWIFLSAFIIMNLFVGVVVESFQRNTERSAGTVFLSERQQKWVLVMSVVTLRKGMKVPTPPLGRMRRKVFFLVISPVFEVFIIGMIIVSVLTMSTTAYSPIMTPFHSEALRFANYAFCIIFSCECILKNFGLGIRKYFGDGWNCFDFILVFFSIFDLLLEVLKVSDFFDPVFIRAFRLVRIGRLLRLIRGFKPMVRMIETLATSLPALVNVLGLMMLLLAIYAIVGVSLFHNVAPKHTWYINWQDGGVVSFQNFPVALLTLFRCVTGESWNGLMHDLMISEDTNPMQCTDLPEPRKCSDPVLACIYFLSFTVFATFMLLNLLIGVILQNFSATLASGSCRSISVENIDEFTKKWLIFDPAGTHQIPEVKVPVLLHQLRVYAWVYHKGTGDVPVSMSETLQLFKRLRIVVRDGRVNFQDTLQAISRAIHHGFIEEKLQELDELENERFRPTDPKLLKTVAGVSHEEVGSARSKTRKKLKDMQRRSLVRTNQLPRNRARFLNKTSVATQMMAARILQTYWMERQMKTYAKLLDAEGKLESYIWSPPEGSSLAEERREFKLRSYMIATFFIACAKREKIYRRHDYSSKDAKLHRIIQGFETAPLPAEEGNPFTFFASRDHDPSRGQPPMSTGYATLLIQNGWRALLEYRAFIYLRIGVLRMQNNWRRVKAQKAAEAKLAIEQLPLAQEVLGLQRHLRSDPSAQYGMQHANGARSMNGGTNGARRNGTHDIPMEQAPVHTSPALVDPLTQSLPFKSYEYHPSKFQAAARATRITAGLLTAVRALPSAREGGVGIPVAACACSPSSEATDQPRSRTEKL